MNLTLTIILSLVGSIIGGVISGLIVMRKVTHDAKRLYARQMYADFDIASSLTFVNGRNFLESLGYEVGGLEAYRPCTRQKENLAVVNRIKNGIQIDDYNRLEAYGAQDLIKQVNDFVKSTIEGTPGFKGFMGIYLPQSTHFDGLCEASSAVETLLFFYDQIPKRSTDTQLRIYVSNIAHYLLNILSALLKAGTEIDYYSRAKPWTWRFFMPIRQEERRVLDGKGERVIFKWHGWRIGFKRKPRVTNS